MKYLSILIRVSNRVSQAFRFWVSKNLKVVAFARPARNLKAAEMRRIPPLFTANYAVNILVFAANIGYIYRRKCGEYVDIRTQKLA